MSARFSWEASRGKLGMAHRSSTLAAMPISAGRLRFPQRGKPSENGGSWPAATICSVPRKKSLAEEIAALDVMAFDAPVLPRKENDQAAREFRYKAHDLVTLQKLIERDYTIPAPQAAEEVIGSYARRIAQDVKLPS